MTRTRTRHAGLPTNWAEAERAVLLFDLGTRWNYGINTDLVGKAVEAASGQTLDAYMRDHIYRPLGMHDTVFVLSPAQHARLASRHARQPDSSLLPVEQSVGKELGGAVVEVGLHLLLG